MKIVRVLFTVIFSLVAMLANAAEPTRKDAQEMVERGAEFIKVHGKDKLQAEVSAKKADWVKGELYLFAYDMSGKIVMHPTNPALVGKNMLEVPDVDGKRFRKDIVEGAKTKGAGWVDYKYKNPVDGKIELKTSFFMKAGDWILTAGVYAN
jgi:signal transduction histidine kinase